MSKHDVKKGDRVTWIDYKTGCEVKGEVLKVFRNGRAQVLSGSDFEKYNIEQSRLSVCQRQGVLMEVPEAKEDRPVNFWEMEGQEENFQAHSLPPKLISNDFGTDILEANNLPLPPTEVPPTEVPPTNLPPTNLPPTDLLPGHWIEKKLIHGEIYLYERWREEIEIKGIKKRVKRSKYWEKVTID